MGFIVCTDGIRVDPSKIKSVVEWPMPTNIHEVRNFYGFATFYHRFNKGFSTLATPITECLNKEKFSWGQPQDESFLALKEKLRTTHVLALPNFNQALKLRPMLVQRGLELYSFQEGHPIEYFSEKLSEARQKWTAYE